MPYVIIKITREGTVAEQKAALRRQREKKPYNRAGVQRLLLDARKSGNFRLHFIKENL